MSQAREAKPAKDAPADRRFEALLDAAVDAIVVIDHNGLIETWNPAAERMFGYTGAEVIGHNVSMLMPEPFRSNHDGYLRHYLQTGRASIIGRGRETLGRRRDGSTFPIDLSIGEIRETPHPHFVGIVRDISARKATERALRQERDRAQDYLDLAAVVLVGLDVEGRVRLINKRGCELLGYEEAELLGLNWFDTCIPPDERPQIRQVFLDLLSGDMDPSRQAENGVRGRDGSIRQIIWKTTLIRDEGGTIIGTLSSGEDVTDKRRTAEQLRQREEELQLVFQKAPLGTVTLDHRYRLQAVNSAMQRLLRMSEPALIGKPLPEFVHPEERSSLVHQLDALLAGQLPTLSRRARLQTPDGRRLFVMLNAGVVHDANKRPKFLILQIEDQTEQRHIEQEARELRNRLTQVGRLSTMGEMAASLAHEINQPLTAIATYAQAGKRFLEGGKTDTREIAAAMDRISAQAQRAGEVIRSLRQFLRQKKTARETLDCNELVLKVVHLAQIDARSHDAALELSLAAHLPPVVADPVQIQQVILNLIRNALDSITGLEPAPPVEISSRLVNGTAVEISVRDYGAGVAAEMREHVFTPFRTSKEDGMGMGLSISRSIIVAHGGLLDFESEPDHGARFFFTLPTSVIGKQ